MEHEYEPAAEFIDIMLADPWKSLGPALSAALDGLHPGSGPIVDAGAGGGHGTAAIADALPEAEILAVEPSPALRSVLLSRVHADEQLRTRVTVLPEDLLNAPLPDRLSGLAAMNVIGHFNRAHRAQIWKLLAERLDPQGRAVLNLLPPITAVATPNTKSSNVSVGRRRYEGWARAEPTGDDQLTWHMTYRTFHDGDLIDERQGSYKWWVFTPEQLRIELAAFHLQAQQVEPAGLDIYVIRREST